MKRYRITYRNTNIEAPDGEFIIGRGNDCHLVLDDPSVSRIHAVIAKRGGTLYVEDKGSRNGVIVNKTRISGAQQLNEGDQIVIGHQVITIAVKDNMQPERTQGIVRCPNCGGWSSGDSATCSNCGKPLSHAPDHPMATPTKTNTCLTGRPSFSTLCELVSKAIQVGKIEEAERLMETIYAAVKNRLAEEQPISTSEFEKITEVMLSLAQAAKSPALVSRIFSIYVRSKRLMSRETVEMLYDVVRPAGYLACPEMTRYLGYLDSKSEKFSPGELFVQRRLNGLVKLCS